MRAASASQSVAPILCVVIAKATTRAKAAAAIRVSRVRSLALYNAALAAEASPAEAVEEAAKGDVFAVDPEAPAAPSLPFAEAAFLKPARCIFDVANAPEVASTESLGCASEESPRLGRENTPEKRVVMQEECQLRAKFFRRRSWKLGKKKKKTRRCLKHFTRRRRKKNKKRENSNKKLFLPFPTRHAILERFGTRGDGPRLRRGPRHGGVGAKPRHGEQKVGGERCRQGLRRPSSGRLRRRYHRGRPGRLDRGVLPGEGRRSRGPS